MGAFFFAQVWSSSRYISCRPFISRGRFFLLSFLPSPPICLRASSLPPPPDVVRRNRPYIASPPPPPSLSAELLALSRLQVVFLFVRGSSDPRNLPSWFFRNLDGSGIPAPSSWWTRVPAAHQQVLSSGVDLFTIALFSF